MSSKRRSKFTLRFRCSDISPHDWTMAVVASRQPKVGSKVSASPKFGGCALPKGLYEIVSVVREGVLVHEVILLNEYQPKQRCQPVEQANWRVVLADCGNGVEQRLQLKQWRFPEAGQTVQGRPFGQQQQWYRYRVEGVERLPQGKRYQIRPIA